MKTLRIPSNQDENYSTFFTLGTINIYSSNLPSQDALELLIKIQHSGLNIPLARTNGFITIQFIHSCYLSMLCEARVTGILSLLRTLILPVGYVQSSYIAVAFTINLPYPFLWCIFQNFLSVLSILKFSFTMVDV